MAKKKIKLKRKKKAKVKKRLSPDCERVRGIITHLGKYFEILNSVLKEDDIFWFRGNANINWELRPSALRFSKKEDRNKALSLISDFRRFGEIKIQNPPSPKDKLKWVQLAQHYGLPTRLLDWTQNAAIALYFACQEAKDEEGNYRDGAVYVLNPIDLNREVDSSYSRIFDFQSDSDLINAYLNLGGVRKIRGFKTIAINPIWNSERIMLQQGMFTLHGSKNFSLTNKQVPSLVYLKIRIDFKESLLVELERVGINEMTIFPETEHMCRYLKWREKLT